MSEILQLQMRVAGLARQVEMLREDVSEQRRAGGGDRLALLELCRQQGWTVAEALGKHRNEAVRALRVNLSAARVGKVFELTPRQVRRICSTS